MDAVALGVDAVGDGHLPEGVDEAPDDELDLGKAGLRNESVNDRQQEQLESRAASSDVLDRIGRIRRRQDVDDGHCLKSLERMNRRQCACLGRRWCPYHAYQLS